MIGLCDLHNHNLQTNAKLITCNFHTEDRCDWAFALLAANYTPDKGIECLTYRLFIGFFVIPCKQLLEFDLEMVSNFSENTNILKYKIKFEKNLKACD